MSDKKLDIYSNYNEYYKNFLGGWSFENGDEILTITDVTTEEMYDAQNGGKKQAPCLHFAERELPMVLNKTNADMVAKVTESEIPKDWVGKKIVVGQSKISAFGKTQLAIRVRDQKPKEVSKKDLLTDEQYNKIQELIENGTITNKEAMLKHYKIKALEDMTTEDAQELIRVKTEGTF